MLKALPVAFVTLFLIAGCVTVAPTGSSGPSTSVTAAPSLGVTTPAPATVAPTAAATPTAAPTIAPPPTLAPTATPTATPTPTLIPSSEPSVEPSTEPSIEASSQPSGEPSSRDVLFEDDMSNSSSGWQESNLDFASITYDTGVLAFRFDKAQAWAYSVRKLDSAQSTVLMAADFSPQSAGIFGELCGDSVGGKLYGAVVDDVGSLVFLETDNGAINVLERQQNLPIDQIVGGSNPMAMECNANGTGGLTMIVGLANTGPIGVYRVDSGGPTNIDVLGLYGEATTDGYTLAVDTTAAYGVGGPFGTISAGAEALMAHIPDALQNGCYESPQFSDAAEFKITCIEQTSGTGAEIARYEQFADNASMDAAYQDLVTAFGVESTGSCKSGPNEAEWTVNEETGGRVQCAPQTVGIRFDWTDDQTAILSALIDLDGSYIDTYNQWQDAGPIIPQG